MCGELKLRNFSFRFTPAQILIGISSWDHELGKKLTKFSIQVREMSREAHFCNSLCDKRKRERAQERIVFLSASFLKWLFPTSFDFALKPHCFTIGGGTEEAQGKDRVKQPDFRYCATQPCGQRGEQVEREPTAEPPLPPSPCHSDTDHHSKAGGQSMSFYFS